MAEKSCGNCMYCQKMIPMREGLEPLWVCHRYYGDMEIVNITPPLNEACEMWEEMENK